MTSSTTPYESSSVGEEFFFAAIRANGMPMVVTDPRQPGNPIVFVNSAFGAVTGYGADEVVGRNCRFLQGPATDPDAVSVIRRAIEGCQGLSIELVNYRKDGSSFWNALFISPVFDAHGQPLYFFASQLDVTRRREIEEALARDGRPETFEPPRSRSVAVDRSAANPASMVAFLRRWHELERLASTAELVVARRAIAYSDGLNRQPGTADKDLALALRDAATRAKDEAFRMMASNAPAPRRTD